MNIRVLDSQEQLDDIAAEYLVGAVERRPDAVLGLATGSTPIGIYEKMVEKHRNRHISFREATTFNLDEYVGLDPDHEQSYASYMHKHLFQYIDLPEAHAHLPNGMAPSLEEECKQYERLLAEQPVDIQLLGLGHNGHIGFNEPGDTLSGDTHAVVLQERTREANARFFNSKNDVPTHAITMGVGSILKAKTIILAVRGADKADIVREALFGPITTDCPASLLQTHGDVIVLLDREAGRKLAL
ncbi:glucosamine-6-phosphate deaminase [Paenibacillus sp. MMS18-CY102]|uniref:glucosamine-6-phosphate deaminase n=1 Tax=Paenibacillus sp. MMS18-CY102 TaxID=2682849 RepID=UPI00136609E0|nr:glucosamine-6-phosphate deaminase [Paenibacillus sp. MMS18-CY102]MWC28681.1 glucosamine-6-phosphate deaminase [Paenibacillus sp. MMS18-CY102]